MTCTWQCWGGRTFPVALVGKSHGEWPSARRLPLARIAFSLKPLSARWFYLGHDKLFHMHLKFKYWKIKRNFKQDWKSIVRNNIEKWDKVKNWEKFENGTKKLRKLKFVQNWKVGQKCTKLKSWTKMYNWDKIENWTKIDEMDKKWKFCRIEKFFDKSWKVG